MSCSKKKIHGKKISHVKHTPLKKEETKAHRKHKIIGAFVGIAICLAGSTLATTHFPVLEALPVFVVDGVAYFIHGVGAIPLLRCFEPIWKVLMELE